ncbi:uncharacterized protein BDZ99DRAFT_388130 [Mytilinidion resinicola]|uniref:Uncharacterized protein n=1 Tax=Mytilinidion resinicola TaxID=574789 RepID=A0A6A6YLM6_9PEZI|nr:uncharacterized protein BDZ99DRAFT_388130 [Mytilinidion resinicola]KAF2809438.1 hypothetical protein BDZ99DRAFT_388130 [Mytilinidion resinicola]
MLSKTILLLTTFALSTLSSPVNVSRNDSYGNQAPQGLAAAPACGPDPVTCRCPTGSFYQTSTSYSFYPVAAKEVTRITGHFLDTAWFGTSPNRTTGQTTTPGAKRYLWGDVPDGKSQLLIAEKLTQFTAYPNDGGYYMKFQMDDAPVKYAKKSGGKGVLAGSWDIVDVREVDGQTFMLWNIYVCFGDLFDFKGFHESAMKNVTAILKKQGKISSSAQMVGPISF